MLRIVLFFVCLPIILISQQQVSDIEFYGTYEVSNTSRNVGFTIIDGVNYMLQENDSLSIYRWEDDSFRLLHVVEEYDNQALNFYFIDPNRSLFEIRDGKYYRIFENGLQIVDVVSGVVEKTYNGKSDGMVLLTPLELYQDRFYFWGLKDGVSQRFVLDLLTDEIRPVTIPNRSQLRQVGDLMLGVENDQDVYITNLHTKEDSLIITVPNGIRSVDFSAQDSMYIVLSNDGSIWKINTVLALINTDCVLSDLSELRAIKVNGDHLIAIYNHTSSDVIRNRVQVIDLTTCEEEISFITNPIESFAVGIQFVINETDDGAYSLFGFYGQHPSDGPDNGLYYILDHHSNHYEPLVDISSVRSHTPFMYNGNVYFVGFDSNFWVGALEYFVKYNFEDREFTRLDPDGYQRKHATLGYVEGNQIFSVTNSIEENPTVRRLGQDDVFTIVQSLSFLYNLGVNFVNNVTPLNDRVYFTTNGGLYSILDDDRIEIAVPQNSPIHGFSKNIKVSSYEDNICIVAPDDDKTIFQVLNTSTGDTEVIEDTEINKYTSTLTAGPFHFYSAGNFEDELLFFDSKTSTITAFPDIPFIIDSWLTPGKESAIFIYDSFSSSGPPPVYQINYSTNEIKQIDIELESRINVYPGYDDSFYFVDWDLGGNNTHIRLLKKDGDISTIYDGPGRYLNFTHAEDSPVSFIGLRTGETVTLIVNDLSNTEIKVVDHLGTASTNQMITTNHEDKIVIRTTDVMGDHYWYYQAFGAIREIQSPVHSGLRFSDLNDSLLLLMHYDQSEILSIVKYDYKNDLISTDFDSDVCEYFHLVRGIRLNNAKYLLVIRCDSGYEPWLLDIENDNLTFLKDINPGFASSSPFNFVRFRDWVYFTATMEDRSRQWFRMSTGGTTNTLEVVEEIMDLQVYPNPTANMVYIDKDLEELSIYSMNGQMVHKQSNYQKKSLLQTEFLPTGSYVVYGIGKDSKVYRSRLIKVNP